MASDNILNALLGVIQGSQQGVDLYLQDSIARRRMKEQVQLSIGQEQVKSDIELRQKRALLPEEEASKIRIEQAKPRTTYIQQPDGSFFPIEGKVSRLPQGSQFTPAQKAVDVEFGKDYAQYKLAGGYANIDKELSQLESAISGLSKSKTATGPVIGNLPMRVREIVAPKGVDIQQGVEEVITKNLRKVFGPQFTEKEGAGLIARAYNPRRSEKQNAERVGRLLNSIRAEATAKEQAGQYYEQNGTLKGYQGKTNFSLSDVNVEDKSFPLIGGNIKSGGGGLTPEEESEFQELDKIYGR